MNQNKVRRTWLVVPVLMGMIVLSMSLTGWSQEAAIAQRPVAETIEMKVPMRYLEYLPAEYEQKEAWPLVIFLHGAGERGDDLELVKKHGPPKMVEQGRAFPFILLSPQCPAGRWWEPMELEAFLDHVVAKYKVDEDRIYVTGLSMGGYGTWGLAQRCGKRLAAIVPICGGGNALAARYTRSIQCPVWAFHGEDDRVVPLSESEKMVDAVKSTGVDAKLTVYPGVGHDAWTQAYANEELWDWLLAQRRGGSTDDE